MRERRELGRAFYSSFKSYSIGSALRFSPYGSRVPNPLLISRTYSTQNVLIPFTFTTPQAQDSKNTGKTNDSDSQESAPILSYDLPEPIQYTGYNLIEIKFPSTYFTVNENGGTGSGGSNGQPSNNNNSTGGPGSSSGASNEGGASQPPTVNVPPKYPDLEDNGSSIKDELMDGWVRNGMVGPPPRGLPYTAQNNKISGDRIPAVPREELKSLSLSQIENIMTQGLLRSGLVSGLLEEGNQIKYSDQEKKLVGTNNLVLSEKTASLTAQQIKEGFNRDRMIFFYRGNSGVIFHDFIKIIPSIQPRFLISERYVMASFLGNYAAGRVLKTHTLAPGEETTISIRTFKQDQSDRKEASSIFDSLNESSEKEFERSLSDEQSNKTKKEENFAYYADANAKVSWGFGSVSVEAGVSGGTTASREAFTKSIGNAISKHAAKASSKRDIEVNTETQTKSLREEEVSNERRLKNVNVSKTMNLIFRQMNQEYITIVYLTDIKVGFLNGEEKIETPLSGLDALLIRGGITDEAKRIQAKKEIIKSINSFRDYKDKQQTLVKEVTIPDADDPTNPKKSMSYYRFEGKTSVVKTGSGAKPINVSGYVVSENRSIIRTDGVVMDVFLGRGNGLDTYSENLQKEANRKSKIDNNKLEAEVEKIKLGLEIARSGDEAKVKAFHTVFFQPCCSCKQNNSKDADPNPTSNVGNKM